MCLMFIGIVDTVCENLFLLLNIKMNVMSRFFCYLLYFLIILKVSVF